MPKYQLVATTDWKFGDACLKAGEVAGTLEADIAPFLLVEGERSGRLQVVPTTDESGPPEAVTKELIEEPTKAEGESTSIALDNLQK